MLQKSLIHYFKNITQLTVPILSVRILHTAIAFIGMIFIAQLGEVELAAGALVTALSTTVQVIAMSPMLAVGIIVSRYLGENKTFEIGQAMRQAWLISFVMGLLGSILFWQMDKILAFFHQPEELIKLIRDYFHGLAWGLIPTFLIASCHQLVFPLRKGKMVIIWTIFSLVVTVLLGACLVFGIGLPMFGISGWSYSVSIVNWILFAWVLGYLCLHPVFRPFKLFDFKKWIDYPELALFFKISCPITLQFANELLAFSLLNIMVGWLGVGALSVQQIVIQCSMMVLMIPMGVGQAAAMLIGHAIGRKETIDVRKVCYASLVLVSSSMLLIAILYLAFPMKLISLYLPLSQVDLIVSFR